MPGKITFALADYHHSANLSLPSSEWDRVGQFEVNTRQVECMLNIIKSQVSFSQNKPTAEVSAVDFYWCLLFENVRTFLNEADAPLSSVVEFPHTPLPPRPRRRPKFFSPLILMIIPFFAL